MNKTYSNQNISDNIYTNLTDAAKEINLLKKDKLKNFIKHQKLTVHTTKIKNRKATNSSLQEMKYTSTKKICSL